jgi:hypothetical protein
VTVGVEGGEGETGTVAGEAMGFTVDVEVDVVDSRHAGVQTVNSKTVNRKTALLGFI